MTATAPGGVRLGPVAVTAVACLVVALVGFLFLGAALAGQLRLSSFWAASGVLVIIVVTAVVGLVVASHQPRNPIGWLLAGESVFLLLSVSAGSTRTWCTGSATGACRW